VEQVVENTGFPIRIADEIEAIPAPTDEELALLREIDKDRLYI
jgi:hypothetical protein